MYSVNPVAQLVLAELLPTTKTFWLPIPSCAKSGMLLATKNHQANIVRNPVKKYGGSARLADMNGMQKLANVAKEQVARVALAKKF